MQQSTTWGCTLFEQVAANRWSTLVSTHEQQHVWTSSVGRKHGLRAWADLSSWVGSVEDVKSPTLPQQASDLAYCCLWTCISFGCVDEVDARVPSGPRLLIGPPWVLLDLLGQIHRLIHLPDLRNRWHHQGVLLAAEVLNQDCLCLLRKAAPVKKGAIATGMSKKKNKEKTS